MPHLNLDKTDLKILQILQENGRLSNIELSKRVALSPSPCLRHPGRPEDAGTIQKYAARFSPVSLGLGLQAFIRVPASKIKDVRKDSSRSVRAWPKVLSCLALTGGTDYLLHALSTDMSAFSHFALGTLLSHHGV